MIESILTIMSSSTIGAITGGFFGWLNRKEDRKAAEAEQVHQERMVELGANADVKTSEAEAFHESQKTISGFADTVKSIVRPAITGVLMYMVYVILVELQVQVGGLSSFPPEEQADIYKMIVLNIISLAATAVSWWFASRPSSISTKRLGGGRD